VVAGQAATAAAVGSQGGVMVFASHDR